MRILGIDPGLRVTGYGCVDLDTRGGVAVVEAGVIRPRVGAEREEGTGAISISARLAVLDTDLRAILARLSPQIVAIERVFAHPKHPATAIIMAHARGVMLLATAHAGVRLVELPPADVKKALTGSGRADKGQMQRAVQQAFGLAELPQPADVADALAIAWTAAGRGSVGGVEVRRRKTRARRLPPGAMEGGGR